MKNLIYLVLVVLAGAIIYNLYSIDYRSNMLAEDNRPFVLGLCAGVCGILLGFILLNFNKIKNRKSNNQ